MPEVNRQPITARVSNQPLDYVALHVVTQVMRFLIPGPPESPNATLKSQEWPGDEATAQPQVLLEIFLCKIQFGLSTNHRILEWVAVHRHNLHHLDYFDAVAYEGERNVQQIVFCHHAYHHCTLMMMTSLDQQPAQS